MREIVVISYDICDPGRLRKVFKLMRGHGQHIQYSVFRCELTPSERITLRARLEKLIKHDEDQVMFIDLGPAEGRGATAIEAIGLAHVSEERTAVIV